MGKVFEHINDALRTWIEAQKMFFVATAPVSAEGLINCSPKGMDTFRVIGPNEVAYLDLTGSGIETAAHLQENGRIVFMFCAFKGPPKIVRLHGHGRYIPLGTDEYTRLSNLFPRLPGGRGIVHATLSRISDSCGYAVPHYEYVDERSGLVSWAETKGADGLAAYRQERNAKSLDGLPGFVADEQSGHNHSMTRITADE